MRCVTYVYIYACWLRIDQMYLECKSGWAGGGRGEERGKASEPAWKS